MAAGVLVLTAGNTRFAIQFLFVMTMAASALAADRRARDDRNENGRFPWNHDLLIASVKSFEPLVTGEPKVFLEHAGVPSVARDAKVKNRLLAVFQWFPMEESERSHFDRVALRISNDDGKSWGKPRAIEIAGLPEGFMRPFDPTLVSLPNGGYRLYFTSQRNPGGGRKAGGPPEGRERPENGSGPGNVGDREEINPQGYGERGNRPPGEGDSSPGRRGERGPRGPDERMERRDRPRPSIYSAYSTDLSTFTFEPGERSAQQEEGVVDPAIGLLGGRTYLVAHPGQRRSPFEVSQGYFAVSGDGVQFERRNNLVGPFEGDFIGNLVSSGDGLFFFGGGLSGIWSMSSRDGAAWSAPVVSKVRGGDPSVFTDHAGKSWIVYVGDTRSDAVGRPEWLPEPPRGDGPGGRRPLRDEERERKGPPNDGSREI